MMMMNSKKKKNEWKSLSLSLSLSLAHTHFLLCCTNSSFLKNSKNETSLFVVFISCCFRLGVVVIAVAERANATRVLSIIRKGILS